MAASLAAQTGVVACVVVAFGAPQAAVVARGGRRGEGKAGIGRADVGVGNVAEAGAVVSTAFLRQRDSLEWSSDAIRLRWTWTLRRGMGR